MVVDKIQKLEQELKDGVLLKVKAETSLTALRKEFNTIDENLTELGIKDVKKAEEELNEKKTGLAKKLDKLEEMIPSDIIEKFKNYDFTNTTPNANLEF